MHIAAFVNWRVGSSWSEGRYKNIEMFKRRSPANILYSIDMQGSQTRYQFDFADTINLYKSLRCPPNEKKINRRFISFS